MKLLSVGLLLAALPAFGGQQGATLAPIALYTQFQQAPPPAVLKGMRQELASIMAPMGLRFDWRTLNPAHSEESVAELAVVTFQGRCEVNRLLQHVIHAGPLGWTHISEGVILPFADIDCDGIRTFLQTGLLGVRASEREETYGRAIGRVLAHELYHIFANTQHHGAGGIGKAAYTVENLLNGEFQFDEKEALALIAGKAHELLSLPAADSSK